MCSHCVKRNAPGPSRSHYLAMLCFGDTLRHVSAPQALKSLRGKA